MFRIPKPGDGIPGTQTKRYGLTTIIHFHYCDLFLSACHKKQTALEYEQAVMYEVFPALMDSVYKGLPLITPPPPPPPPIPDEENRTATDSAEIAHTIAIYEKVKAELESGIANMVVAIIDSAYALEPRAKNKLVKHFAPLNPAPDTTDLSTPYKLSLVKLKNNKKIRFKYRSEFPDYDAWKAEYSIDLKGIIGISRIQFDTTKSYGAFWSDIYCGKLCGEGTWVFIRKINGRWVIDRIETVYVS